MLFGVVNTNRRSRGLGIELVGRLLLILAISGLREVVLGIGVVVATACGAACGPEVYNSYGCMLHRYGEVFISTLLTGLVVFG